MLAAQWGKYAVQLASLIVLSRLLSPSDFGLFAMTAAVIGIAAVVGDFGLSLAALTGDRPTQQQSTRLFYLNLLIGAAMSLITALSAPMLVSLFDEPRLLWITVLLAPVFLINGATVQFKVILNLDGQFIRLATLEFSSAAIGLAVAITSALLGCGYWALILQALGTASAQLATAVLLANWRPIGFGGGSISPYLRFGRDTMATQIANYVASNIDSVAIGRVSGSLALGLYNRAFQLATLPVQQIAAPLTRVMLPRLARTTSAREASTLLARMHQVMTVALLMPLSLLAATAPHVVQLALGSNWTPSGHLIRILCIASAIQSIGYSYYWLFLHHRRTGLLAASELSGRLLTVGLILMLVSRGPAAVAWAVVVGQVVIVASSCWTASRYLDVAPPDLVQKSLLPLAVFGAAAAAGVAWDSFAPVSGNVASIASCLAVWSAVFCAGLIVPGFRRSLSSALGTALGSSRA